MQPHVKSLLLGGILPIVIFTVVEEMYGTAWGMVAGMVFGVGEILYEWRRFGRVETMTWVGNGMILGLGGVSLVTQEGIWFKLQPAIIEAMMALILCGSVVMGKPLLLAMMRKQNVLPQGLPPAAQAKIDSTISGLCFRMGLFFAAHAGLAAWAAFRWSTAAWAVLKGVGFTISMVIYLVVEMLLLRYKFRPKRS